MPAPVAAEKEPTPAPFADDSDVIFEQNEGAVHSEAPFAEDDDVLPEFTETEPAQDTSATEEAEPAQETVSIEETPEPTVSEEPAEQEPEAEIPVAAEENGGFFGNDDGDDTIALSLDEMDNILNTAAFTEEEPVIHEAEDAASEETAPAEETAFENEPEATDSAVDSSDNSVLGAIDDTIPVDEQASYAQETEPQMDFASESLEEPVFEENEPVPEEEAEESSLPEEIPVPKVEDVIVESEDVNQSLTEDNLQYLSEEATEEEALLPEADAELAAEDTIPALEHELAETAQESAEAPQAEETEAAAAAASVAAEHAEPAPEPAEPAIPGIPSDLRQEIKSVLSYMDQLLENLPEDKIAEFAQSDQFETYKKLFKELGLA
ncbi:MAG: hypothetical protein K6G80_05885 [Treponema sp.]|nr:hypothetical protein [Treponema sp.]